MMKTPREAQLPVCCSPVVPSPPMGFPPTLQKVPPTQHTLPHTSTRTRLWVCTHTHTHTPHTHDSTLRNSANPLKIVLRGKTVCSFTRYHSLESTAVCSAAGSQAPCLMALHLNVYSLRPISAGYRQLSLLPLTSEQTHLRSLPCYILISTLKFPYLEDKAAQTKQHILTP